MQRSADTPAPAFSFVLKNKSLWGLWEEGVGKLERAWPRVDVRAELTKAASWLTANAGKRKTARGMPRFIDGWLRRAEETKPLPGTGPGEELYFPDQPRRYLSREESDQLVKDVAEDYRRDPLAKELNQGTIDNWNSYHETDPRARTA